jgi:hypothetical protein
MMRLATILMVLGFGSALLHFTDIQLSLMMWSEPMQPALGLIVGAVGLVVAVAVVVIKNNKAKGAQAPRAAHPQQPYGQPGQGQSPYPPQGQPRQ